MGVESRLTKLEKKHNPKPMPCVRVMTEEGEDHERAINEKLAEKGLTKNECLIINRVIVKPSTCRANGHTPLVKCSG